MTLQKQFDTEGYTIVKSLLDRGAAGFLTRFATGYASGGQVRSDSQVPGTPAIYGAPVMEKLLHSLVPAVEKASGRRLFPTYSYFRVYKKGDSLARHKDREACEISVSVCLGYEAETPWPLFVEGPFGTHAAKLEPGDGLLYKGTECPHWREPFEGEMAAQVFLHYVDQAGPYADWRFDKRTGLNEPAAAGNGQHAPA